MIHIAGLRYRNLAIESLHIPPGITSIIGKNGSGKTTLLKLCAGIALPETGRILIGEHSPRMTAVGWVNEFPDRNFLFDIVSDEIASAPGFQHLAPAEVASLTAEILGRFGINRLSDRSVRELSGGEKILIALAAAMVTAPRALILDEFDSHLDHHCMEAIRGILRQSGIPCILRSTQDMETAAEGDHLIFLEKGRVRFSGTPDQVFSCLEETPFYPMTWRCRV